MPPKERRGMPTSKPVTTDPKSSSASTRSSMPLARKVVLREALKIGHVDHQPHSDSPPPPPSPPVPTVIPGETKKGKQAVAGQGVSNYLASVKAKEEATVNSEAIPLASSDALGRTPATGTSPEQENRSDRLSYVEESFTESADGDGPYVDVSIHSGTESTRDSMSHQSATSPSPRQSLKGIRNIEELTPEELRQLQHHAQSLVMEKWRGYIDNYADSDQESVEHDLKTGQIPLTAQRFALFYAEHRLTMALKEHEVLLEQAQYTGHSKYSLCAESLLTDVRKCSDANVLSQDAKLDTEPRMAESIIALAKAHRDLNAGNKKLLVKAHEWRLLKAWIENKSERLKYQVGETPKDFDEMYISPKPLKEGACFIHEQLVGLKYKWKDTLKSMKVAAENAGVSLDETDKSYMGRRWLEHVPTGYYGFYRMGFDDIRRSCVEGHGDTRFPWDVQTCLKSLALRAKSMHEIRNEIDVLKLKCQEVFDAAAEYDSSDSDSKHST